MKQPRANSLETRDVILADVVVRIVTRFVVNAGKVYHTDADA